jgi:lipid-binding SYLF domain-containing protein
MMALEGASFGFQAGGQATDFVLVLMNPRATAAILSSKVKLGVEASAAAGPLGRATEASLDVSMRAEILSYARSRSLFARISLTGSTLRADNRANQNLYKKHRDAKEIVLEGEVAPPHAAERLLLTLNSKSPSRKGVVQPAASARQLGEFYATRVSLQQITSLPHERTSHEYGRCFSSPRLGNS